MKVLYLVHEFYPAHHGGCEKFVLQLAQQMQAQGHQVKVVAFDRDNRRTPSTKSPPVPKHQLLKKSMAAILRRTGLLGLYRRLLNDKSDPIQSYEELYQGVPVIGFRSKRIAANRLHWRDTNLTAFAQTLLQREAPDLIHAGYVHRNSEFLYVAQQLGIPYVITLTSYWLICPRHILITESGAICDGPRGGEACKHACPRLAYQELPTLLMMAQQLLAHAAAVIAPSHHLKRLYQREFGVMDLTYIPYGMDLQHLPFNSHCVTTGETLTFFFAGRLVPEKGLLLLLAAFKSLTSPHIRLQIYGMGSLAEAVAQAAQADPRIHYGGVYANAQIGYLLQQADVVVVPSTWHENLPLIMQEAQACGVPTLVADVGGMTECVTDGVNGFTFRIGDVDDLQRKMQLIIDQPEVLNGIKENMRNPKPGQYRVTSLGEETNAYLQEYQKIIDYKRTKQAEPYANPA